MMRFETSNKIKVFSFNSAGAIKTVETAGTFTSTSAWYFVTWSYDFSQALGSRSKVFVNGVDQTLLVETTDTTIKVPNDDYTIGASHLESYLAANQSLLFITDTAMTISKHQEVYNGGVPLDPFKVFGTDCKYFFNPVDAVYSGGYTVTDATNSITATSVNIEEADLKYRAPNVSNSVNIEEADLKYRAPQVSYSVNMEVEDKDCDNTPYSGLHRIIADYGFLNAWSSENLTIAGTDTTANDYLGEHNLVNPAATNQPTLVSSDANFGGKPSLTFDGTDDHLYKAANFPTSTSGVTVSVFRVISGVEIHSLTSSDEAVNYRFTREGVDAGEFYHWSRNGATSNKASMSSAPTIDDGAGHVASGMSSGSEYFICVDGVNNATSMVVGVNDGFWQPGDSSCDNIIIGAVKTTASVYGNIGWCFSGYLPYTNVDAIVSLQNELKTYYGI